MKKLCLVCDQPLIGRVDKKFCSDNCRNRYHNGLSKVESLYMRRVHYVLRRNRRILLRLSSTGKDVFTREELAFAGFDINHMTSQAVNAAGTTHFFCYDIGYSIQDDGNICLVRKGLNQNSGDYLTCNIYG